MTYFSRMCELFILLHDITRKYKYSENCHDCGPPSSNKFETEEVGQGHGIVQIERVCHKDHACQMKYQYEPVRRSIGRIDPADRIIWRIRKWRSNSADALATYWRRVYNYSQLLYRCVLPKWHNLIWICRDWEEIFDYGPFSAFFNDFEIFNGPFLNILHTL